MAKSSKKARLPAPAQYVQLVSVLLLALCFLAAYFAAVLRLTPKRYELATGDTVTENIYADRTVEDDSATLALQQAVAGAVQPVYTVDAELVASLTEGAQGFFTDLAAMRAQAANYGKVGEDSAEAWDAALTDNTVVDRLCKMTTPSIADRTELCAALAASNTQVQLLRDLAIPKLTTALSGGLSGDSLARVLKACVSELSASTGISDGLKQVGESLLTHYMQPTYVVDEAATAAAQQQALAKVGTVTIQKGDVLVPAGSTLSAEQLAMLQELQLVRDKGSDLALDVGLFFYLLCPFALFAAFLIMRSGGVFTNLKQMLLLTLLLVFTPLAQMLCFRADVNISPALIAVMLAALLINGRTALGVTVLLGLQTGLIASTRGSVMQFEAYAACASMMVAGFTTAAALKRAQTRGTIIAAGGVGSAAGTVAAAAMYVIAGRGAAATLVAAGWTFASNVLCTLLVVGSLSLWENLFDVATPARLNELLNTNHPLLRQLMYEAPGTYQHSMNVASLAEAAAQRVGADALLARVGGFYHDVGKLRRPLYFTENQKGENIHDTLPPLESATIIIAHQKDSVQLLNKYKMPGAVIRIAAEHHGNSLVAYFYHKACEEAGGEAINPKPFRYPAGRPSTKESALVLLADCCEAAVRSLGDCTREQREEMVHKVVWSKLKDGDNLLANAPLTMQEISEIERSFLRTMDGLMHDRIEYPAEAGEQAK